VGSIFTNKFGFTGGAKIFERAGGFLDKAFYNLSASAGTIFLTFGGAFAGSYKNSEAWELVINPVSFMSYIFSNPYVYLLLGAMTLLFGGLGIHRDQKNLETENAALKKENNEVELVKSSLNSSQENIEQLKSDIYYIHQKLVETWLKGLAKQIHLDTHSRITIYYENEESFTLLARYSSNPKLAKKHKMKFGLNQGVISKAWEHGEFIEDASPSYSEDSKAYAAYMINKYQYSIEEVDAINMKSCRYFALAITEADDNIGVILFESEQANAFAENKIDEIRNYCSDYQSHLCNFVRDGLRYDRSTLIEAESKATNSDAEVLGILEGRV